MKDSVRRLLSPRRRIARLYREGRTVAQLARRYHACGGTVIEALRLAVPDEERRAIISQRRSQVSRKWHDG